MTPDSGHGTIRWSLLTMAGLAAGILAAFALEDPLGAVVGMILITPVLTLLVGAVLGAGQWLELRRRVVRAWPWIPATCLGMGIGLAAGVVLVEQVGNRIIGEQIRFVALGLGAQVLALAVVGLVTGLCVGAAQWLSVLRRHGAPALRWIAVSSAALGIAFPAAGLIVALLLGGIASPAGVVSLVLLAGLFFGAGTARAITRAV